MELFLNLLLFPAHINVSPYLGLSGGDVVIFWKKGQICFPVGVWVGASNNSCRSVLFLFFFYLAGWHCTSAPHSSQGALLNRTQNTRPFLIFPSYDCPEDFKMPSSYRGLIGYQSHLRCLCICSYPRANGRGHKLLQSPFPDSHTPQ